MKNYWIRIGELRHELTDAIIDTLRRHGLDRLEIPEDYEEATYVMWVDNDGYAHDCRVNHVSIYSRGISLNIEDNDGTKVIINSEYDVGCRHVEWLASILDKLEDLLGGSEDNMDAGEEH